MDRQSFVPETAGKYNGSRRTLSEWFGSDLGRYVLEWERAQFDRATEDVFGFRAAQAGLPEIDFLRCNRIPYRFTLGLDAGASLVADPLQLPLANQSLDLLALPHALELTGDPHHVLREAERVLRAEGQLVISGFNPLSAWGVRHWVPWRKVTAPWDMRFLGLLRLKDWLRLLGFELNGGRFGCYAPPFRSKKWLERFSFLEHAGERWWPVLGGAYVVRAVKRTHGLRVITPAWRKERARRRALSAIPQRNGQARQADGHRRQSDQ